MTQSYGATAADRRHARRAASVRQIEFGGPAFFLLARRRLEGYDVAPTRARCKDAHDCSLTTADTWLKNNIAPLIASATFQQDGLLIIVFDESASDNTNGGGRIAWVVVGPKAKLGYQSTTLYQHQSTLRLILEALGVTQFPGAVSGAPEMAEFFSP